jgi:hypothetical protein
MKPFTTIGVVIFGLVALAHLLRLCLGWVVTINGATVPAWVSMPGFVLPAALALLIWRESRK